MFRGLRRAEAVFLNLFGAMADFKVHKFLRATLTKPLIKYWHCHWDKHKITLQRSLSPKKRSLPPLHWVASEVGLQN